MEGFSRVVESGVFHKGRDPAPLEGLLPRSRPDKAEKRSSTRDERLEGGYV